MAKKILAGLVLVVLAGLIVWYCTKPQAQETGGNSSAGSGLVYFTPFSSTDLYGQEIDDSLLYENQLTLVHIFPSWAEPAIEEIPVLLELEQEFADKGFAVLGVLYDGIDLTTYEQDPSAIEAGQQVCAQQGVDYPVVIPDESIAKNILAHLQHAPTSLLVNGRGQVVAIRYGAFTLEEWRETIEELYREEEASSAA